jgi:hypothetical protein
LREIWGKQEFTAKDVVQVMIPHPGSNEPGEIAAAEMVEQGAPF